MLAFVSFSKLFLLSAIIHFSAQKRGFRDSLVV